MKYVAGQCAPPDPDQLRAFWAHARQALGNAQLPDHYQVRWIGFDADTTEQVLELIRAGDKTGTFTLPWVRERTERTVPQMGDAIILIDFAGRPQIIVRITQIDEVAFGDIGAEHTAIDGSPVRALDIWKPMHTDYWNAMLAPLPAAM